VTTDGAFTVEGMGHGGPSSTVDRERDLEESQGIPRPERLGRLASETGGAAAVSEIEAREDRGYGGEAGAERDPVAPGSSSKNADAISISRGEDEEEEEEEERATPPASAQASRSSWRGREET